MDKGGLARRLEFISEVARFAKETPTQHFLAHHAANNWSTVNSDSNFEFFIWQMANFKVFDFVADFDGKATDLRSVAAIIVQSTAYGNIRIANRLNLKYMLIHILFTIYTNNINYNII